jgi:hypothetical protein
LWMFAVTHRATLVRRWVNVSVARDRELRKRGHCSGASLAARAQQNALPLSSATPAPHGVQQSVRGEDWSARGAERQFASLRAACSL